MPTRLETLGTLRAHQDGRELERLPAQPVRCALLLYLAVEREVARDAVLATLWPEHEADRARHALSQTVYELRQLLGDDWVELRGDRLHVGESVTVDALDFVDAVERGEPEKALELYGGPFLGGACPPTTRAFEGWADGWQAKLVRLHRRARREAIEGRVEAGEVGAALELARAWAELDPLDDEAQHRLIELQAASGDRSGALRQYERYEALVRGELELEPLDETKELVARIRGGGVGPADGEERAASDTAETADRVREAAPAYAGAARMEAERAAPPTAAAVEGGPGATQQPVRTLREELRARRVVEWAAAYLAGSIAVLEGVNILFGWPEWLQPRLWLLVGLGLLIVLIAAWNHGESGIQRVTGPELATQGLLVGAIAVVLLWRPGDASRDVPAPALTEIAVLHLDDFSTQPQPRLADQITEALIAELDWSQGIEVRPRAAVAPFRDRDTPLDSVARRLGVGAIVEGSIHDIGELLRLNVQVFDAGTHEHLLTDTLQAPLSPRADLLHALPREAARSILRTLGEVVRQREVRSRTDSERARELYGQARRILEDERDIWTGLDGAIAVLERADSLLQEAERADPDWPDATVLRAEVWRQRAREAASPGENYEPAATRAAIGLLDRVLRRHPGFAPALEARGFLLKELAENQPADTAATLYRAAQQDLTATVEVHPNRAGAWIALADVLHRLGQPDAAFSAARKAHQADAFLRYEYDTIYQLAIAAHDAEMHQEADRWCAEGRERFPDVQHFVLCRLFFLGAVPELAPDVDWAWALVDSLALLATPDDRDTWRTYGQLFVAKTLARAGLHDSARAVIRGARGPEPLDWLAYDEAHARLLLGERDRALDLLRRYVETSPAKAPTLATDWYFRPLQGDPAFQALIAGPGPG